MRFNAADPGYTATDFNRHRGSQTVTEGTDAIVALATEDPSGGGTGRFIDRFGPVAGNPQARHKPAASGPVHGGGERMARCAGGTARRIPSGRYRWNDTKSGLPAVAMSARPGITRGRTAAASSWPAAWR
jgi:hypothetical protein